MIFIETERLRLRSLSQGDADIMFDYRNNEICSRCQRGQTKDRGGIVRLIERRSGDRLSAESPCMLAIAIRETDEMIGEVTVKPQDGVISLGYTLSYKHHRQGYAFEALTALIGVLQDMAPEAEFICYTDPGNIPSMRLLEKLGYRKLGYVPSEGAQAYGKRTTPETEAEFARFRTCGCNPEDNSI